MGWELVLLVFLGVLLSLVIIGVPVAFAFLFTGLLCSTIFIGIEQGPAQATYTIPPSIISFALVPIPLFILMGEILYHSGLATRSLDALGKWLGPIPGRLGLLSMGGGTVFAVLSGSAIANTAMLGSLLIPEMRERGYSKQMSAGPILGAGPLAMMFPPSALAVLVGTIGGIPVGPLLIAGIVPGVMLAVLNGAYIFTRAWRRPDLAPRYEVRGISWSERFLVLFRDILPLTSVFFVVVGSILLGIATPTEAAALGALASVLLVAGYRKLTLNRFRKAMTGTVQISGMVLLIMAAAAGYSGLLAFSGATRAVLDLIVAVPLPPVGVMICIILLLAIMGSPLEQVSILLITMPILTPAVIELGYEPIWWGLVMLLSMDIAGLTPPLGMTLFVLKGVAPPDFSIGDVISSAIPFLIVDFVVLALLLAFPDIAMWLPNLFFG